MRDAALALFYLVLVALALFHLVITVWAALEGRIGRQAGRRSWFWAIGTNRHGPVLIYWLGWITVFHDREPVDSTCRTWSFEWNRD